MAIKKKPLGEMLVEAGVLTDEQLLEALAIQKESGGKRLGNVLKEMGMVDDKIILTVLESQLGVPYINLNKFNIEPEMARYIPVNVARRHNLVPLEVRGHRLHVAMEDPFSFLAIDDVRMVSSMDVRAFLAKGDLITKAIDGLYSNEFTARALQDLSVHTDFARLVDEVEESGEDEVGNAPVVRLVNSVIEQAVKSGASDVHIEPLEDEVRVRTRVDGIMTKTLDMPMHLLPSVIARIKIMGNMNIAEKRLPLDGRAQMDILGHDVDIRISTLPTVHGEKAVLRLLDRSSFLRPKAELGFTEQNLQLFNELLLHPYGIILVTGPTGSGKSTTLYTMLDELNGEADNIITVEDPVEYMIEGLNQVNVNPKAGLDFPTALRSILRQDPDKIMIGEIRDSETVEIAVRAAITGHLVLSTIHTNDAASTVSRLLDMGVEKYLLSSALVGIIAQRLVRKICPMCKEEIPLTPQDLDYIGTSRHSHHTFYHGKGCSACNQTGYRGRIAVHEVMMVDRRLRDMISRNANMDEIRDYAITSGMSTLKQECIRLLNDGVTTIDEVYKVAYSGT